MGAGEWGAVVRRGGGWPGLRWGRDLVYKILPELHTATPRRYCGSDPAWKHCPWGGVEGGGGGSEGGRLLESAVGSLELHGC